MRKLTLLTLLAVTFALPLQARNKDQSYISYDDGGTVVRSGEDSRDIEARVNLPIYPGDEVITNRRGRVEIRLSDSNVIGIDRGTALRFQSMLDNYEGEDDATIAELRYGKVIVYRTSDARDAIRIDTPSASYFASREAIFSVEADTSGKDRVNVLDGTIEVRTPERTTRLRTGERVEVDDRGLYSLATDQGYGSDDFERWFIKRAERYGRQDSRYLDRSLAYYEDDLNRHGSWTYISGYGYGWRPSGLSAGWRPYYYGQWSYGRSGCLTWVSYEPWGWVPYHYGRWAYDPFYGWFWLPGTGYSPAWVYWWYGNGYLGWAPAGYWDCYRPYYSWAYQPYTRGRFDIGFGFYGRVRAHDVDMRPWTFIDSNTVVSTRVDRAAITTDVIRGRLFRDGDTATIGTTPARFSRTERKNPASAVEVIARRGGVTPDGGFGRDTDLTSFIRRDREVSGPARERIMRSRPVDTPAASAGGGSNVPGSVAPIGRGAVAPVGGGSVAPIGSGSVAPIGSGSVAPTSPNSGAEGRIQRGGEKSTPPPTTRDSGGRVRRNQDTLPGTQPGSTPAPAASPSWRDRVSRTPAAPSAPVSAPAPDAPVSRTPETRDTSWRNRVVRGGSEPSAAPQSAPAPRAESPDRSSDVPRRVIDGTGGPRVVPSDGERSSSSSSGRDRGRSVSRERDSGRDSSPPPSRPASVDKPRSSPPPQRESPPPKASEGRREGGRSEGGRIKREKD